MPTNVARPWSCRAGRHLFVFVQRGPLYLVAVSASGEPPAVLEKQLGLVHAQIVCILTNHFDRMLAKNPRFDSRRLLGACPLERFWSTATALCLAFEHVSRGLDFQ